MTRKITRIVMDTMVEAPEKTFFKGQVYDSRIPENCPPANDGVQHHIQQHHIDYFVESGAAHEETPDEWWNRIEARRREMLDNSATDEGTKALIRMQSAYAAPIIALMEVLNVKG